MAHTVFFFSCFPLFYFILDAVLSSTVVFGLGVEDDMFRSLFLYIYAVLRFFSSVESVCVSIFDTANRR